MEQVIFETEDRTKGSGGRDTIVIKGDEHFHLARVLRVRGNEKILATDGNGTTCLCVIKRVETDKSICEVIEEYRNLNSSLREFCIGMALLRPISKLEFAIEKCTELGASRFMLFNTERSEKVNLRVERLNGIIRAAVKQSLQSRIPALTIVRNLEDVALQDSVCEEKFVLHEKSNIMVQKYLSGQKKNSSELALVGPEGGFSDSEINFLVGKGFKSFSLGMPRLRSETAAIKISSLLSVY